MLKVLRDNLKYLSWILWLVVGVFVLFVFVDFGAGISGMGRPNDSAAQVGKEKITFSDFERTYKRTEDQYRQAYGDKFTPELAQRLKLPLQVLDQMVARKILLAEARRMGLEVGDRELRQAILSFPAFTGEDGRFVGEPAYQRVLQANGLTPADFEAEMREDLLVEKLTKVMTESLYIPDEEVEKAYREQTDRAKIRFVRLPSNRFAGKIEVSPAEVESYFAAHADQFEVPERRVVDYLLVDTAKLRSSLEPSRSELEQEFAAHADDYKRGEQVHARHILIKGPPERSDDAARKRAEEVKQRIDSGADFAAVAREVSEDPGSKTRGGDLGTFGRNQMVEAFDKAAFAAKPGEVVGPVKTQFGYHLIQVLDRHAAQEPSFEQAENQVRARYVSRKATELAEAKAKELAGKLASGKSGADAMRRLAEGEPAVTFATTQPFDRATGVPGLGRDSAFLNAAFTLQQGKLSEPVRVARGWAVLRLSKIESPHAAKLDEVRPKVKQAVAENERREQAKQRLAAAKQELVAGKSLDDVAKELGVSVEESGEFGPGGVIQGLGINPGVSQAALDLDQGDVGGPLPYSQGELLFVVSERQRFDPIEFAAKRKDFRQALERNEVNQLLSTLVAARRKQIGVSYSKELLQRFDLDAGASKT